MSRDMTLLKPSFGKKVKEQILAPCRQAGFEMRVFFTQRDVIEQAKLWRQSRTKQEIDKKIQELNNCGASFLADCIKIVGPQHGRWATNAIPGLSWHQHGEAVDCFHLDKDGNAVWDSRHPAYTYYAERAVSAGFEAGHFWRSKDSVHVQMRKGSVSDAFTLESIDVAMRDRYADLYEDYAAKKKQ